MAKSIPEVKIGNEVYQVKDRTAREHLVEVSTTQPTSEDNKLWIKNQEAEYEVPTMDEFDDLKSALGGNYFETTGSGSNKELCKFYPQSGHTYLIIGYCECSNVILYDFDTGGQYISVPCDFYSGIKLLQATFAPRQTTSYLRIYLTNINGIAKCNIVDITKEEVGLSNIINNLYVSGYKPNTLLQATNLMGFSSVYDLPPNKIFAISNNIDSSTIFPGLPEYGVFASIVSFSPRVSYSDNRHAIYLYSTYDNKTYIGYRTVNDILWERIDNGDFKHLFGNPKILNKSFSSNAELTKLYPDTGKKYDILLYNATNTASITMYEFDTNGNYQILQAFKSYNMPFAFHYEPSENADYLRIYMRPESGTNASVEACILESENILSPFMTKETEMDYLLSKEFAAVRKFTVIGDSMASGYYKESSSGAQYGRNIDYSWPQIMARTYGQTAVNATQSGATTESWWTDSSGYCKAMVTSNTRSQVYIMALGTNDYKDVADADITEEQIETFVSNYCRILDYVHEVAPDAKIICCTIPPPRPNTTWKQEAIRGICEDSNYTDFVCLCDLMDDYSDLSNSDAMRSEMWQSHFTPVGYANSASFLMYAFSKTIRANRSMFINLPLIPFDPVS